MITIQASNRASSPARREAEHLRDLLDRERQCVADFLLALAAFDRARRWADLGHASLWAFLHVDLGLSAGAAHWRKVAARLVSAFPAVEAGLRQGDLCLSSVVELAKVLTSENQAEVLKRFQHLSSREAKAVVAELTPAIAFATRERVTSAGHPVASAGEPPPTPASGPFRAPEAFAIQAPETTGLQRQEPAVPAGAELVHLPPPLETAPPLATPSRATHTETAPTGPDPSTVVPPVPVPAPPPPLSARPATAPDDVVPLTGDLRRLHLTVTRRFVEKLAAARRARAHAQPGASSGEILEAALDLLLARDAVRRKAAAKRPAERRRSCSPGRVQASVRREVWRRDGGRCQWPLEDGGVCGSTWRLELDHIHPKARGGPSTTENLRLLCGPHNAEAARRAFGEAFMTGKTARQQGSESKGSRPVRSAGARRGRRH